MIVILMIGDNLYDMISLPNITIFGIDYIP